jgi:hypothetical protein
MNNTLIMTKRYLIILLLFFSPFGIKSICAQPILADKKSKEIVLDTTLNLLPIHMPDNFDFTFRFWSHDGTDGITISTFEHKIYRIDCEGNVSISFSLSKEQLDSIYMVMRKIHLFSYPAPFPDLGYIVTPPSYEYLRVRAGDIEKQFRFKNIIFSKDPAVINLCVLEKFIIRVITDHPDYSRLPQGNCLYE